MSKNFPWSESDLALVKSTFARGGADAVVAAFPCRKPSAVLSRLYSLGIAHPKRKMFTRTCNRCDREFRTACKDYHTCPKCKRYRGEAQEINGQLPMGDPLIDLRV